MQTAARVGTVLVTPLCASAMSTASERTAAVKTLLSLVQVCSVQLCTSKIDYLLSKPIR